MKMDWERFGKFALLYLAARMAVGFIMGYTSSFFSAFGDFGFIIDLLVPIFVLFFVLKKWGSDTV